MVIGMLLIGTFLGLIVINSFLLMYFCDWLIFGRLEGYIEVMISKNKCFISNLLWK